MEKEIQLDGLNIAYEETGNPDGLSVILLHGWGCNYTTVRSIANTLSDKMHIYSLDLPGHGKSSEPDEVWGTFDFANLVEKFIEALNIKKPSVIGHSFGGRTAIALATRSNLNKIVLVDSAGVKPKRSLKYYYKVYSYKIMKRLILAIMGQDKGKQYIERQLKKKASADYLSSSPRMRAVMSKCVNEDLKRFMPDVKFSTLLIWGENDTATPLSDAKIMEKLMPDAGLVSFAGCGHYSFLDNPRGFKAVIREFFKDELNYIL